MESKGFSIGTQLKKGWSLMKENLGFFIPFIIVWFLFQAVTFFVPNELFMGDDALLIQNEPLFWLSYLAMAWLLAVIALGMIKSGLKVASGVKPTLKDLFSTFSISWKYVIASIIYVVIVSFGLLLFVLPGIYWLVKFSLYPYFILEKNAGPIEALKMSSKASYGFKWDLWMFIVASYFVSLLGYLALLVGVFVATPVVFIAWGLVYRKVTHVESH